MKKTMFRLIVIFFMLIHSGPILAKIVQIGPGSEVTTGRIISSKWLNYSIDKSARIVTGNLEVRVKLVRAPFSSTNNINQYVILPASGAPLDMSYCFSREGGYGGCYTTHLQGLSCTSADNLDIEQCLNRIAGKEVTAVISIKEPTYQLAPPQICIRSYLEFPTIVPFNSMLNFFFDPYLVCSEEQGAPPVPPELDSKCSLGADVNFTFSSNTLDVSGISATKTLPIFCPGTGKQNYQLKLTGSNVVNGRLSFGNGVSAQISLNGSPVQANGAAISLTGLETQNMPITASLVGTANTPGVSNAVGILLLEAL